MKFNLLGVFGMIAMSCLMACNSAEEEPAVIIINDASISTTSNQGADTDKITDLWVFTRDQEIGVFPIPAQIPIFEEGPTELIIAPGIRVNGIRALSEQYFPLEFDERTVDLTRGLNNDPFDIVFTYRPTVQFAFIEDFESGVEVFGLDLDDDASTFMSQSGDALTGSGAGRLAVDEDHPINIVANNIPLSSVLDAERSIFLEVDYKLIDSVEFTISTVHTFGPDDEEIINSLTLRPRTDWNKVYYDLSGSLLEPTLQAVSVVFSVRSTVQKPSGEVLLDNIKLLYE